MALRGQTVGHDVDEVREIVRFLGAEDLKMLDTLRRRRRILGIVLIIIGIAIIAGIPFYMNMAGSQAFLWVLFSLFIGSLFFREGSIAIHEAKNIAVPGAGRYKVFAKLTCTNASCGFSKIRERRTGEYVGMIVIDERCPKCDAKLIISAIFSEPEKKIKTIGMPILPTLGGQIGFLRLLIYYLADMLSPFKLAFRAIKRKLHSTGEKREKDN